MDLHLSQGNSWDAVIARSINRRLLGFMGMCTVGRRFPFWEIFYVRSWAFNLMEIDFKVLAFQFVFYVSLKTFCFYLSHSKIFYFRSLIFDHFTIRYCFLAYYSFLYFTVRPYYWFSQDLANSKRFCWFNQVN